MMEIADFPLVSIVIPVYNAENYIEETLQSVLSQSYKNLEMVLVDDGSTDRSWAIIKQYESPSVHVFSIPNAGAAAARNYGIERAKGLFIQHLDADDLLDSNKIESQINMLRTFDFDPHVLVTCAMVAFRNSSDLKEAKVPAWEIYKNYDNPLTLLVDTIRLGQFFYPHTYLVHRDLIREVGGWDETFSNNDDGVFFAKIILAVYSVVFCKEGITYHRNTPNSLSSLKTDKHCESLIRSQKTISRWILERDPSEEVAAVCFNQMIIQTLCSPFAYKIRFFRMGLCVIEELKLTACKIQRSNILSILQSVFGLKGSMYIFFYYRCLKQYVQHKLHRNER